MYLFACDITRRRERPARRDARRSGRQGPRRHRRVGCPHAAKNPSTAEKPAKTDGRRRRPAHGRSAPPPAVTECVHGTAPRGRSSRPARPRARTHTHTHTHQRDADDTAATANDHLKQLDDLSEAGSARETRTRPPGSELAGSAALVVRLYFSYPTLSSLNSTGPDLETINLYIYGTRHLNQDVYRF